MNYLTNCSFFALGILSPVDEFQYWDDMSRSDERAATFVDLFKPISKEFGGLDAMSLMDVMELVEVSQDTLDDVWKCTDYDSYPEPRMKHLMDIIGRHSFANLCSFC